MTLDVLLVCASLTFVMILAVSRYGSLQNLASMVGIYLPRTYDTSDDTGEYDPDEYDFGLDDDDETTTVPPPAARPMTKQGFFGGRSASHPMATEDDPAFLAHVAARAKRLGTH